MGKIPHGCARTTPATRRLIQQRTESLQTLATRFGIDPKTVDKWRSRSTTEEAVRGPKPASTVLTPAEEAAIVLFRKETLLPSLGYQSPNHFETQFKTTSQFCPA